MARSFLTAINLNKNELQNAAVQNLGAAPSSPVKGQLYFNSTGGDDTLYWWSGSQWIAAKAAAGATPAATVTTQAVGDAPVVGISTNFAREDHKHGREAFGVITAEATFGSASGNGAAATVARSDHTHGNPVHDNAAHAAITLNSLAAPTADRSMGGFKITGLAGPATGTDAATKTYVDNNVRGGSWKNSVRAATTANIALSGMVVVDGVTLNEDVDHVLVKNQTTASQNGIYYPSSGAWYRTEDASFGTALVEASVFVQEGTVNADTAWTCTTNANILLGTTALTFVQFAGPPVAPVSFNSQRIISLADPTAATDATTKQYVDNAVAGLSWKDSVRAASTVAYISPPAGVTPVDGVSIVAADRVLLKNQANGAENGLWRVVSAGNWVRQVDADTASEIEGAAVFVNEGTVNADTAWVCTTNAPITLDTTPLTFVQFAGGGVVTAGAGMTQSGGTLNVIAGDTSLTVAADDVRVNTAVIATVANLASYVPTTRQVIAGAGLVNGGALSGDVTLNVGAGAGLSVAADAIGVNGAAVPYWSSLAYAVNVGGSITQVVNHLLNTLDVVVDVYRVASPRDTVDCDVERTDVNNVTLRFAVAPAAAEYRCVVMGHGV